MFNKLFWALARRRAKRIAVALMIDNNYQCTREDVKSIIGACYITRWTDEKIKEMVLNVGGAS